ncbi:MAG TPA: hypothetical protein PKW92_08115 [Smithella sp.]|jgi:hypothetical protein|nr:hypothetical protein [Smithella sp.]HPX31034.1 hypothetical protein [Smithella sp.]
MKSISAGIRLRATVLCLSGCVGLIGQYLQANYFYNTLTGDQICIDVCLPQTSFGKITGMESL